MLLSIEIYATKHSHISFDAFLFLQILATNNTLYNCRVIRLESNNPNQIYSCSDMTITASTDPTLRRVDKVGRSTNDCTGYSTDSVAKRNGRKKAQSNNVSINLFRKEKRAKRVAKYET
ncbi:Mitogen-activated protein kinase kinase kinase [Dirofilaria immitis]